MPNLLPHSVPPPVLWQYPDLYSGCLQSTNLENAKRNLENNTRELEVLKDFTTITEVQIALPFQTAGRVQHYA